MQLESHKRLKAFNALRGNLLQPYCNAVSLEGTDRAGEWPLGAGEKIREALDETLGAAGPDDTALFLFAGHGTPSHQFAPQDTRLDALADTTLPMDELAERLGASNARVVIVILDCCFSGGATARVLQDTPVPRGGMTTVAALRGRGRVIIAASKDDEEAHELGGHGLLTQALLRTFGDSPDGLDAGAVGIVDILGQ